VALRYKEDGEWIEITYGALLQRVRLVAAVLSEMKVKPGERVAIYLENCPAWPEIYFAIVGCGLTAVPVDGKLREQEAAHVLRDSESRAVFTSAKAYRIVREIEDGLPELTHAVILDGLEIIPHEPGRVAYADYGEALQSAEKRAAGNTLFEEANPSEGDVASIIYTSGTTGRQKGAMLTHGNFCSNVEACSESIAISQDENFLLVLPLHHSFAFTTNLLLPVAAGAEISFIESLKTVGENVREVSPTVLIGVPLLLEKMYARIWSGLKKKKAAYLLYKLGIRKPVTKGILKNLGGKLRLFVVGGAPASPDVLRGFEALGIPILEGYGLTETAPVLTLNPPDKPKPGSVGKPIPGVDIKIVPPNAEGVGEIAAKGPNLMKGYFRNPQATAEVFDEGWFLTGDLGTIDEEGYVTITGRKKSLIVNREGKNIYPEEVEACVCQSPFILEALALGYTAPGETGERVGVIVVPDQEALDAWRKHGKPVSDEDIKALMKKEVKKVTANIADYKRPRRIQVRTEEFEKTSTAKVKRYLYEIDPTEV